MGALLPAASAAAAIIRGAPAFRTLAGHGRIGRGSAGKRIRTGGGKKESSTDDPPQFGELSLRGAGPGSAADNGAVRLTPRPLPPCPLSLGACPFGRGICAFIHYGVVNFWRFYNVSTFATQ